MARAFDDVHREAVRLAAEQALLRGNVNAMFTNLSRRSQGLIQRQLSLISELESREADPDQLSSLFKLDHLATRMRRNGENLLVLAGEEPGRRWTRPVPLVDVLRAAASEVEQYERIELTSVPVGRGRRPGRQRPRPPARRAAGERHLVLLPADQGARHRPRAARRPRADRDPRHRHRPVPRGPGRHQRAAGQPAHGGRLRLPPHGPVRGRPAVPAARHPHPAAPVRLRRHDRAGHAARGRHAGRRQRQERRARRAARPARRSRRPARGIAGAFGNSPRSARRSAAARPGRPAGPSARAQPRRRTAGRSRRPARAARRAATCAGRRPGRAPAGRFPDETPRGHEEFEAPAFDAQSGPGPRGGFPQQGGPGRQRTRRAGARPGAHRSRRLPAPAAAEHRPRRLPLRRLRRTARPDAAARRRRRRAPAARAAGRSRRHRPVPRGARRRPAPTAQSGGRPAAASRSAAPAAPRAAPAGPGSAGGQDSFGSGPGDTASSRAVRGDGFAPQRSGRSGWSSW